MPTLPPIETIGTLILAAVIILLSVTIFGRPLKLLLRLLLNTIGGFLFLFLLNFLGQFVGISLGINLFNAVVVGIFGLSGLGLLLILPWLLSA